ncbi:MAG: c-type cytochrome [Campylobacterota bacterium]|nr:c-type cytochrome [Campylobacterota bacterium]
MIKLLLLFSTTMLLSQTNFDNSFITQYEYGKMLYNSPRGISCVKCHGEKAKGKVISTFKHIRNKKEYTCSIKSTDITNISYNEFQAVLDPKLEKPKKKFTKEQVCEKLTYGNSMPTYFLTDEELTSIYFYLTNIDKY